MIEVLNKLINILVGTSGYSYILKLDMLRSNFQGFLYDTLESLGYSFDEFGSYLPEGFGVFNLLDFGQFMSWFFSSPNVIISFVFYLLCAWGVLYFCLIVPYRFIKSLLPKAIKGGK